ncbi:MAG: hypothetical protein MUF31_06235 [Akkermansiaceae bacterium]|jgi:hypothetical protein|nr:hypothetical protein [Akkermansiaceae bacterium]
MTSLKKHIVYTLLSCYTLTTISGICVLLGVFKVSDPAVIGIFAAAIAQTAAIIVAFIKAPEYFKEPEAIAKLKEEHLKAIAEIQGQLDKCLKDRENTLIWVGTKIMPDDSSHPLYEWIKQRNVELQNNPESLLDAQKSKRRIGDI